VSRAPATTGWRLSRRAATTGALIAGAAVFLHQRRGAAVLLPSSWCRWNPAHAVPALTGGRLLRVWQLDGPAIATTIAVGCAYTVAARRVRRRHPLRPWAGVRSVSFAAGLAVVLLATCSSVGVYDMTQFWVHMVQHLLLIMVAPPFLAAGRPLMLLMHAVRNPWHTRVKKLLRGRVVSVITSPPAALTAYAVTIVGTHLTGVMDQVMQRPWLGQGEHLLYLVTGWLFFALVFGDEPIRWHLAVPARLLLVAVAMAVDTFVGLALMASTTPIDMTEHPGWGLAPLADTQAGGGIMWVFGDTLMIAIIVALFLAWVRRPEHARRRSRSWLEQVRRNTLQDSTGVPDLGTGGADGRRVDLDDDDAAHDAYNAWLARLAHVATVPPAPPTPSEGPDA